MNDLDENRLGVLDFPAAAEPWSEAERAAIGNEHIFPTRTYEAMVSAAAPKIANLYFSWFVGHAEGSPEDYPERVSICGQHSIPPYKADFFVTGYEKGQRVRSVAVEVDGHDFHERTKEQAKHDRERDRAMQRFGFAVFRFAGSEVWADPIRCARDAVRMALGWEARP